MIENISDWPISKLTAERDEFLKEVISDSLKNINETVKRRGSLGEEIEKAIYLEKIRINENPWKVDPKDERSYWNSIKSRLLITYDEEDSEEKVKNEEEIATDIVTRYANEIVGNFDIPTFKVARRVAPFMISRLLNTASNRHIKKIWSSRHRLRDRIIFKGHTEDTVNLAEKGTIVLVPTHFSNLDSMLVGFCLDLLKLPPFLYGAGLNLYNNSIIAHFIDRLGAYKVDRRKKNRFYLETLKSYSRIALQRGCHSLFFPGGTRSRSGGIEKQLKLGLLGTAFEAQYHNYSEGNSGKKIFIVPVVIGYHFVLEAASLIKEHLKRTGKEKYFIENDQFSSTYKILKFLWDFFSKGSQITLSFGKPMDIFGNYIDAEGESLDKSGNKIDTKKYFYTDGKLKISAQRDAQYAMQLGKRIVEEYYKNNLVLTSHLVAFTAFELLRKQHSLDLYALLRIAEDDRILPQRLFKDTLQKLMNRLMELEKEGKVCLSEYFSDSVENFMAHGIRNLGLYHTKRVLYEDNSGHLLTDDMNLLYFYRNRMDGYELERYID